MSLESFADRIAKLPHRKLALLATELYERSIAKTDAPEAIAVTGMACRFPGGASSPEAFWSLLARGGDAIGAMPPERLAMTGTAPDAMRGRGVNWGGFLDGVDAFDPALFGISAKEAESMDPQQRILLEVCWEALENAGVPMDALPSETGVFMGISGVDYAMLHYGAGRGGSSYLVTGVANAVAAGRISYSFGLGGPSSVVDTACSASASAIHLACQSLQRRECEQALAGGVNLLLLPQATEMVSGLEGLARDGRCKAFSADADGFVRSEGCGVLVLRRLSEATARGEPILGVIHGSAWNQDGKSGGLTAPNGVAQEKVIRAALANARLSPDRVSYVEAHGTGTALGDPIEVSALARVFAPERRREHPLLIGSVKTNVGHLEAAAGVAGVIKVLLAFRHGTLPPHLHCDTLNPRIEWAKLPFQVTAGGAAWPGGPGPRIAGVSSFGFSGTNVHLVLGEPPAQAEAAPATGSSHTLLALSAKSRGALLALAKRYADALQGRPALHPAAFAAAANQKRAHFAHRLALDIADAADAATELQRFSAGDASSRVRAAFVVQHRPPSFGLLFGDARPDPGFVQRLYETEPGFRAAYDAWIDAATAPDAQRAVGLPVLPLASACIGYQFAVAALWRCWGLKPVVAAGEGAGEVAAALVAGGLTLDQAAAAAKRLDGTAGASAPPVESRLTMKLLPGSHAQPLAAGQAIPAPMLGTLGGAAAGRSLRERAAEAADGVLACDPASWGAILADLSTAYLAGAPVDWRRLHETDVPDPAPLPNYPFQRSRFWPDALCQSAPVRQAAAREPDPAQQDGLFGIEWRPVDGRAGASGPAPMDVIAALRARVLELRAGQDFEDFRFLQRELNRFAMFSICEALRQLRPDIGPGAALPADDPGGALGVVPGQRRLAARMMQCLEACGLVERRDDAWVITAPLPRTSLPGEIGRIIAAYPRFETEIRIAAQAERLPDVLRGHSTGVDVLFPNGSPALVDALYRDSAAATVMNRLAAEAVHEVARAAGGRRLRILEIGGGTGSTTAAVLPRLPENVEYVFTDISPAFLSRARASFAQRVARYEVLDIESDADVRAFAQAPFDVVVAANVLHATKSVRETLKRAGSLLRPGGALVLLEGTESQPIADVTLGMLEGWWLHEDAAERSSGPLLSREQWMRVLADGGFEAETLPAEPALGGITAQQTIVVARRRDGARPVTAATILHRNAAEAPLLRAALEAAGLRVHEATPASAPKLLASPESDSAGRRDAAWIYLPGAAEHGTPPTDGASTASADLLALAETFASAGSAAPLLWIVTSGAQPVHATIRPGDAALWGIARVMRSETPELRVSLLDLDHESPGWQAAAALIASGRAEPELAVANGQILAPTLAPVQLADGPDGALVSPEASYIVTGAFGVLGSHAAQWLAAQGAGKLFLVGRNQPGEAALRAITAARFAGTAVETVIADVANESEMDALFARIAGDRKPLKGILHAAAALDDAPIARQTKASFARAFEPKAKGAWLLHEHSLRHSLDFFVLYSSMAALIGSAGQANYAAANCFIDALAHHRRALGFPALSVNWGLWAKTGAAVRRDVVEAGTLGGVTPITPEQGHAVLGRAIAAGLPQIAVFPADRAALRQSIAARPVPLLLSPLLDETTAAAAEDPSGAKNLFNACMALMSDAGEAERSGLIMRFVRKRLPELLNLDPAREIEDDRMLLDLGLDSLVGLELKNEVQALSGLKLPSTLFFDCPTLGDLARYIAIAVPAIPSADAAGEARERVLI